LEVEIKHSKLELVPEVSAMAAGRKPESRFTVYRRVFSYLKVYKKQFILALLCMTVFGASDGAVPFIVKYILDGVFTEQNRSLLYILPLLIIIFAAVRALCDFGQNFLMARMGHLIVRDLRNDINSHLLKLSPDFFLKNSSGNLLSRITSDVLLVRTLLTDSVSALTRDTIRIVALIIAAIVLDPFLALIAFVAFPIGIYPVYKFGKKMRRLSKRGQDAIGSLSTLLQETVVGHKVVAIFGREKFEKDRFEAENENLTKTFVKSEKVKAITGPVNEVLASFAISGVVLYGGLSVIGGYRSQGDFIAFLIAVFLLYDPFKKLSRVHNAIQQGISGAERIFEVLDTEPTVVETSNPKKMPEQMGIRLKKVSFSYQEDKRPALSEVSLEVKEGQKVAIVGFSGAGKSTLIDLIPRFIDVGEGQVEIGGVDVRDLKISDLRSRIAMVGQHTFLFNDTIFQNIAYGKEGASEEEVIEAAKAAYAYDFIMKAPQGFSAVVGESGLTLSGGERQRIAIARAILKDAPILILDEATASLDNQSEHEVQAAIKKLERDRTTIVIAHRLSTVRDADAIVVLKEGRLAEQGTHEELLKKGGEYAKLHAMQFLSKTKLSAHEKTLA